MDHLREREARGGGGAVASARVAVARDRDHVIPHHACRRRRGACGAPGLLMLLGLLSGRDSGRQRGRGRDRRSLSRQWEQRSNAMVRGVRDEDRAVRAAVRDPERLVEARGERGAWREGRWHIFFTGCPV